MSSGIMAGDANARNAALDVLEAHLLDLGDVVEVELLYPNPDGPRLYVGAVEDATTRVVVIGHSPHPATIIPWDAIATIRPAHPTHPAHPAHQ